MNILLTMQRLCDLGATTFDFLAGATPYKLRLATGQHQFWEVTRVRPTMASLTTAMEQVSSSVVRKFRRRPEQPVSDSDEE